MHIRKANPSDKLIVLDFCKSTFSWGDYIAEVWDNWISEGNLIVFDENQSPIAICHASVIRNEQVWIEGIRVKENFRRKGLAKRLVKESELIAKKNHCKVSKMLIETNNIKSLNLVSSLNYTKEEKWNFYTLFPKKTDLQTNTKFAKYERRITDLLFSPNLSYVRSWRWLPLTKTSVSSLLKENKILFSEHKGLVDALAIIVKSDHFEKTLMVTIVYGNERGIDDILFYIQNFSYQKNYTRIQILTKTETLPKHDGLKKKFSFYLMKKDF